jgi:hypothetical protein
VSLYKVSLVFICYVRKVGVPQSFFKGNLGSAKLFEVILGSATSKRLKNTAQERRGRSLVNRFVQMFIQNRLTNGLGSRGLQFFCFVSQALPDLSNLTGLNRHLSPFFHPLILLSYPNFCFF